MPLSIRDSVRTFRTTYRDHSSTREAVQSALSSLDRAISAKTTDASLIDGIRTIALGLVRVRGSWCQTNIWSDVRSLGRHNPRMFMQRVDAAFEQLELLAALLPGIAVKPDGYCTDGLCREGDIGVDLFREIVRAAGLPPTGRGKHGRRFSNADVDRLAEAARSKIGTTKARRAADRWRALAAANRAILAA